MVRILRCTCAISFFTILVVAEGMNNIPGLENIKDMLDAAKHLGDLFPNMKGVAKDNSVKDPSCVDNNAMAIAYAKGMGFTISGCADVLPFCEQYPQVKEGCCATCFHNPNGHQDKDTTPSPLTMTTFLSKLTKTQREALMGLVTQLDRDGDGDFDAEDLDRDENGKINELDGDFDQDGVLTGKDALALLEKITPAQRVAIRKAIDAVSTISPEQLKQLALFSPDAKEYLERLSILQSLELLRALGFGSNSSLNSDLVSKSLLLLKNVFSGPKQASQKQKLEALSQLSKALDNDEEGKRGMLTPETLSDIFSMLGSLNPVCSSDDASICTQTFTSTYNCDFSKGVPSDAKDTSGKPISCLPYGVCAFEACQAAVDCKSDTGKECVGVYMKHAKNGECMSPQDIGASKFKDRVQARTCAKYSSCALAECTDLDTDNFLDDKGVVKVSWWKYFDQKHKKNTPDTPGKKKTEKSTASGFGTFFGILAILTMGLVGGVFCRKRYGKTSPEFVGEGMDDGEFGRGYTSPENTFVSNDQYNPINPVSVVEERIHLDSEA